MGVASVCGLMVGVASFVVGPVVGVGWATVCGWANSVCGWGFCLWVGFLFVGGLIVFVGVATVCGCVNSGCGFCLWVG